MAWVARLGTSGERESGGRGEAFDADWGDYGCQYGSWGFGGEGVCREEDRWDAVVSGVVNWTNHDDKRL